MFWGDRESKMLVTSYEGNSFLHVKGKLIIWKADNIGLEQGWRLDSFIFLCPMHDSGWRLKDSSRRTGGCWETAKLRASVLLPILNCWSKWKKKIASKNILALFTILLWSCWRSTKYVLVVSWDNSSSEVGVLMLQGKANKTQQMPFIQSG